MDIQISRTDARIGIETTAAKLNIKTQNADLQLHSENAKVSIQTELPKVVIDCSECYNTSGLKNREAFLRESVQLGKQAASEYISKTSSDGGSYGAIESGSNPMTSIVVRDAYPQHNFGIDCMPKARPQIKVEGKTQITAENASGGANNGIQGNYTPGKVNYDVTPHNVRTFLEQKPSIDIKYVGKNVDVYK